MEFHIEHGPVFTVLQMQMQPGEIFRAEAGAMISMSTTITLEAKSAGKGVFGTLKAAVGGESLFASLFTASGGAGEVILAPSAPGDIMRYDLNNEMLYLQRGAYLAGGPDLELSTQGSLRSMISGEGLFLQTVKGSGPLFLSSYGALYTKDLAPGETYVVDTGHYVAFQQTLKYKVRKASKGLFSTIASGEGLVCEFTGPGRLFMQTRNIPSLAGMIAPYIARG